MVPPGATLSTRPDQAIAEDDVLGSAIYLGVAAMALLFTCLVSYVSISAFLHSRRSELANWRLGGARRAQVFGLVLRQTTWTALLTCVTGVVIGGASVLAVAAALHGPPSASPWITAATLVATLGLANTAAFLATRRATSSAP